MALNHKLFNFSPKNRGFTLIELLVVIAIIGLLASIILVSLNSSRKKSRDARRKADIKQMITALQLYYDKIGSLPTLSYGGSCGTAINGSDALSSVLISNNFINQTPVVPSNSGTCGNSYYTGYFSNAYGTGVAILTRLENADLNCVTWTSAGWYTDGSYCNPSYFVMTVKQ